MTVQNHRNAVKQNQKAPGIIDIRRERGQLLYDVVVATDEFEEAQCVVSGEQTALNKRLNSPGKNIRNLATSR